MHLVIYFCGTGNSGDSFPPQYNYVDNKKVRTLFVKGCDDPTVCGSSKFPNLNAFAKRFVSKLFKREKDDLMLTTTNKEVLTSLGINQEDLEIDKARFKRTDINKGDEEEEIESITLCGYSRGAVTCFEIAKQLHQIAPQIPVDIVANQPVPGNCYQGPFSNAGSIADCSGLTNLQNVSIILGAYTGTRTVIDIHVLDEELLVPKNFSSLKNSYLIDKNSKFFYVDSNGKISQLSREEDYKKRLTQLRIDVNKSGKYSIPSVYLKYLVGNEFHPEAEHETTNLIHREFFSQIVPSLPPRAHRDLIVIPRASHHHDITEGPDGEEHLHMQLAKYLNAKENKNGEKLGLVASENVLRKIQKVKDSYNKLDGEYNPKFTFPPANQLQEVFGSETKETIYRYVDKYHPAYWEREGMEWDVNVINESLHEWWQRHDKKTSKFSTELTQNLVKSLRDLNIDNKKQVIEVFQEVDRWLMLKENSPTSRYHQVESLRSHLMGRLIDVHGVTEEEIAKFNRESMKETDYFYKHWIEGSQAASWFQSKATDKLDEAFKLHAQQAPSEEADRALLQALDNWLDEKQKDPSKTKRLDLVNEMYEHLTQVIENNYASSLTKTQLNT